MVTASSFPHVTHHYERVERVVAIFQVLWDVSAEKVVDYRCGPIQGSFSCDQWDREAPRNCSCRVRQAIQD